MATYEGTVDYFLREFGSRVKDYALNEASDGNRISRANAIAMLNLSTQRLDSRLRNNVNTEILTRKATLTQDSTDTTLYHLPSRAEYVLAVYDSNTVYYKTQATAIATNDAPGVYFRRRRGTTGKSLHFKHVSPSGSVFADVMERPVLMSSGTNAAASSTSITLATAPGVGRNIVDTNYYANADIRITSGSNAGDIQTISSSAALVCIVPSWTASVSSGTDTYSLMCSLPSECWEAIAADAAKENLKTDKECIEFADEIIREANDTYHRAVLALARPSAGLVKEPRQTREYLR